MIVWRPQPRQEEFMRRKEYEALFGGAAGGGKSDSLIIEALRQVHIPYYKGLILRKTFPQLSELIDKSRNYYPRVYPKAKYNSSSHTWTFPSGAKIRFGSMQHASDRTQYQGQAFDFIAFDELTHFTYEEYSYMFSRNRPNGPDTRVYIRATANPGGIGHAWVKERFITVAPPMTTVEQEVEWPNPDGTVSKSIQDRIFVPSSVFDNQALLNNDPDYVKRLAMLPEQDKQALLMGNWDSFSGQVFIEWRNDPKHYKDRKWTHVIDPFDIPDHWQVYRGFDFGYAKPFSVGWFAVDPRNGRIFHIKEYYGCTGQPNVGVMMEPTAIAQEIYRIEHEDPMLRNKQILGIADPSIFDESRGESVAEMMLKKFVYWRPGDNTRIAGKMQYHYRLAFSEDGSPMFQVFNTCKHFIRTIPSLVYDEKHVEDINSAREDHIYDMCRYVLMDRPVSRRENHKPTKSKDDPLDLQGDKR